MISAGDDGQIAKFAFKRLFCQLGDGYSRSALGSTALGVDAAAVSSQIIACIFRG